MLQIPKPEHLVVRLTKDTLNSLQVLDRVVVDPPRTRGRPPKGALIEVSSMISETTDSLPPPTDLKIISMILGQQGGYTKYYCFLCMWDSRDTDNHWVKKDWGDRDLVVG